MRKFLPVVFSTALAVSFPVLAQEHDHDAHAASPPAAKEEAMKQGQMMQGGMMRGGMMQGGMMQGRGMQGMGPMQGQHMLAATVTALDAKTGIVDVTAGAMALKLHFPPATLAGVKAGDRIQVHLAFHKG